MGCLREQYTQKQIERIIVGEPRVRWPYGKGETVQPVVVLGACDLCKRLGFVSVGPSGKNELCLTGPCEPTPNTTSSQ